MQRNQFCCPRTSCALSAELPPKPRRCGAAVGRACCVHSCSGHSVQVHGAGPGPRGVAAAATRATRGSGGVGTINACDLLAVAAGRGRRVGEGVFLKYLR
eukprot:SAG31_NODE_2383_length_5825_cov_13.209745_2_plen_100_part_00